MNAVTTTGVTPMHFAALSGSVEAITALADRGANINARVEAHMLELRAYLERHSSSSVAAPAISPRSSRPPDRTTPPSAPASPPSTER